MASALPVGVAGACAVGAIACAVAIAANSGGGGGLIHRAPEAAATMSQVQAVRLAKQASFGPDDYILNRLTTAGMDVWLEEQFAMREASYTDYLARAVPKNFCNLPTAPANCNRDYFSSIPVAMRFYADAVLAHDQLRQRVAFALSQLVVASDLTVRSTAGVAAYNQMLLDGAFGNYRDILRGVTLSPYMGDFLDLADSTRTAPNENYARELMQLFSLGVSQLNADGTVKTDAAGAPIATYTATDVREVARALTGWTYARLPGYPATDGNAIDMTQPMVATPGRYDTGAKSFLGRTVPANASQQASLDAVIDAVFNHANTAPYVSKFLIQQLVVSNPSPAYVERVARVFADNGAGVRGDLRAVVRAILVDPEARAEPAAGTEGKVKEPVLLSISLARAIGVISTDGYALTTRDTGLGQQPFRSASVFNFYPPDYPLPLGEPLVSPPSKLMTTATVIARHNLIYDWTVSGDVSSRAEFRPQTSFDAAVGTNPYWTGWEAYGNDVDGQLNRINLMLLENGLTGPQYAAIRAAMVAVTNSNAATQARKRAQTGLYLAASSPLFQIDR